MNTKEQSNNERLRELVEGTGLTQVVCLTLFNRGLGAAAYSDSHWRAFFVDPSSTRFRPISDKLMQHAEKVFSKLQLHR